MSLPGLTDEQLDFLVSLPEKIVNFYVIVENFELTSRQTEKHGALLIKSAGAKALDKYQFSEKVLAEVLPSMQSISIVYIVKTQTLSEDFIFKHLHILKHYFTCFYLVKCQNLSDDFLISIISHLQKYLNLEQFLFLLEGRNKPTARFEEAWKMVELLQ